ncbi:hypothetical protein A2U01_0069504, partial [Trifolium medium]|nr:hypothetical protein [Trifolium medium]
MASRHNHLSLASDRRFFGRFWWFWVLRALFR